MNDMLRNALAESQKHKKGVSPVGKSIRGAGGIAGVLSLVIGITLGWGGPVRADTSLRTWMTADNDILFAPDAVAPDDEIIYTLYFENVSGLTVADLAVWDTVPAGVQYVSSSGGTYDGTKISWSFPTLAPGGTIALTWQAKVNPAAQADTMVTNRALADFTGSVGSAAITHQARIVPRTVHVGFVSWSANDAASFAGCTSQVYFINFYPLHKSTEFELRNRWCCGSAPCDTGCAAFASGGGLADVSNFVGSCTGGGTGLQPGCKTERAPAQYAPADFAGGYSGSPAVPFDFLHKVVSNAPLPYELTMCQGSSNNDAGTYVMTTSLTHKGYTAYTYLRYTSSVINDTLYTVNTSETDDTQVHLFMWNPGFFTWDYVTTALVAKESQWAYVPSMPGHYRVVSTAAPVIVFKGNPSIGQTGGYDNFGTLAPDAKTGNLVSAEGDGTFYLYAGHLPAVSTAAVGNVGATNANYEVWKYTPSNIALPSPSTASVTSDLVDSAGTWSLLGTGTSDAGFSAATNPHVYGDNYDAGTFSTQYALYKVKLTSGGPIQVSTGRNVIDRYSGGVVLSSTSGIASGKEFWLHTSESADTVSGKALHGFDVFCPAAGMAVHTTSSAGYDATVSTTGPGQVIAFRNLVAPTAGNRTNWKVSVENFGNVLVQANACNIGKKMFNPSFLVAELSFSATAVKQQDPPAPGIGDPVTYRIAVTNTGEATIEELTVVDTVSPVVTAVTTGQPAAMGAPTVTQVSGGTMYRWSATGITMAPGVTYTFTVAGVVGSPVGPTTVSNTALIIAVNAGIGTLRKAANATGFAVAPVVPPVLNISVVKTQTPASPNEGDPISYSIVVINTGTSTVNYLAVTDTLSPVVVGQAAAQPGAFGAPVVTSVTGGTRFAWSAGALAMAPGGSYTFTISGTIGALDCPGWTVNNKAFVDAADGISTTRMYTNQTGSFIAGAGCAPKLDIWQETPVPEVACAGNIVQYRICFSNYTDYSAFSVTITTQAGSFADRIKGPAVGGAIWASGGFGTAGSYWAASLSGPWNSTSPAGMGEPLYLRWILQKVGMHQSGYIVYQAIVQPGAAHLLPAYATATLWSGPVEFIPYEVPYTATATGTRCLPTAVSAVVTQTPSMLLGLGVGDPVVYQILVTNTGSSTVTTLTVMDTVSPVVVGAVTDQPAGFGPPAVSSAGAASLYVWSATGLSLEPGSALTFTITGAVGLVCSPTLVGTTTYVVASDGISTVAARSNELGNWVDSPVTGVSVVKTLLPALPETGSAVTYTIVVTNTGTATIEALTVTDTVSPVIAVATTNQPGGWTIPVVTSTMGAGTVFAWSSPGGMTMFPGASYTFEIFGTVGSVCAPATVSNTAYVMAASACTATRMYSNGTDFTLTAPALGFSVVKQVSPSSPQVGESVTYRIIVTNTGGATIENVTVVDTVSPVVAGVATEQPSVFSPPTVSEDGNATRYVWSASGLTMLPGASYTFTVTGQIGSVCSTQVLLGTASVFAGSSCAASSALSNPVSYMVYPPLTSVSAVKIQSPAVPIEGGPITYLIVAANTGAVTITAMTVVDTLSPVVINVTTTEPAGFGSPVAASIGGTGTRYTWNAAGLNLIPGASYSFTITGIMGSVSAPTVVNNRTHVMAGDACVMTNVLTNATGFTLSPPLGIIAALYQVPASPAVGGTVVYRIVATNVGSMTITEMTVTDTLSPVIIGQSAAGPSGFGPPTIVSMVGTGTRYVWSATGLNVLPGASLTFTIAGTIGDVIVSTPVGDVALVSAGNGSETKRTTTNAVTFTAIPLVPGLTVTQAVAPVKPVTGEMVTYLVTVVNSGTKPAGNLTLIDTLSPVVTKVSTAQPAGFNPPVVASISGNGTRYMWIATGLNLLPGQSFTITITGTVGAVPAAATISNSVGAGFTHSGGVLWSAAGQVSFDLAATPMGPSLAPGQVKIVGGTRGYINPNRNEQATILARPTGPGELRIRIYDVEGVMVAEVSKPVFGNTVEVIQWNGRGRSGTPATPGLYPIVVEGPGVRHKDVLVVVR